MNLDFDRPHPSDPGILLYQALKEPETANDLVATLRGHLCIEAQLDRLLLKRNPGLKKVVKTSRFAPKLDLALELKYVDEEFFLLIKAINKLRNQFGHNLDKVSFTPDDEQMLRDKFVIAFSQSVDEDATPRDIIAMAFQKLWRIANFPAREALRQ